MGELIPGTSGTDVFFGHPEMPAGVERALKDGFGILGVDVAWDMVTALDSTPDGEYTLELLFQSADDAHAFYQECCEYAAAAGATSLQSAEWRHPVRHDDPRGRLVRGTPSVTCVFRGAVYITGGYERLPMVAGVPDFIAHLVGLAERDALTDEFDADLPARYDDESEPTGSDVFRAQQAADDDDDDGRVTDDYGTPVLVEADDGASDDDGDGDADTAAGRGSQGMPDCPECEEPDVIQLSTGEWVCQACTHVFEWPDGG